MLLYGLAQHKIIHSSPIPYNCRNETIWADIFLLDGVVITYQVNSSRPKPKKIVNFSFGLGLMGQRSWMSCQALNGCA
jgi:hypothetical protein